MRPHTAALLRVLEQQTALCRELVATLQEDRKLVVRHEIEALQRSNERKEALVLQLHAAERTRQDETAALARSLGMAPGEARVSALAAQLEGSGEGAQLETAAANLRAVVTSLRELVAISHGFLEQSILGIRGVLALIASLRGPAQQTYDATGRMSAPAASGGLALRREA